MRAANAITAWPRLHGRMLLPWRSLASEAFPFSHPRIEYCYRARTAIAALAHAWQFSGKEVLVPAYCHGMEIHALLFAEVKVRYYPVHEGMQVRTAEVMSRVTPQTRAVYLIHYMGFPSPASELARFCEERGLDLIEDCALALLSRDGERPLGSFGTAALFRLYKTLPLPHGAALITSSGGMTRLVASFVQVCFNPGVHRIGHVSPAPTQRAQAALDPGLRQVSLAEKRHSPGGRRRVHSGGCQLGHELPLPSRHCPPGLRWHHIPASPQLSTSPIKAQGHRPDGLPGTAAGRDPSVLPYPDQPQGGASRERLLARGIETINLWADDAPGVRRGEFPEIDELRRTVLELPCHQDPTLESMDRLADEVIRLRGLL